MVGMEPTQLQKPFDEWNFRKKTIQSSCSEQAFFYYSREIWWCSLGVNLGVETDGKHEHFERPILVVKKFNENMFWGLPLTSTARQGQYFCRVKYETGIAWAFLSQLRVFSSKRLIRKVGMVSEIDFQNVLNKLVAFLKNETPPFNGRGISEAEAYNESIVAAGGSPSSSK